MDVKKGEKMADKRVYAFGKDQNGVNITEGNTDMK